MSIPSASAISTPCAETGREANFSPLVLADRLLSLAQDADRAGWPTPAKRLLRMAYSVWNTTPSGLH